MKLKGLRWYIITAIAVATVINFIDRSAVTIMWPFIHKDFGVSAEDSKSVLAMISTSFLVAYAIGHTAFGKIIDSIGTRLGMVFAIAMWSISIGLHSVARSLLYFNIFRFFLGFSEAGNWPGATKSNAEWFPAKERAIAQGIFGAGSSIGSVVAAPIIALLFLSFGWRMTFFIIAGLGFLWIIPWLIINRAPPHRHPWITEEERKLILESERDNMSGQVDEEVYSLAELFRFKKTWGIILARFFIDPVWWLFITWLPTFLFEQFSFDIKQIGTFSWLPYTFAAIGGILGGYHSARQMRKGKGVMAARKYSITVGCLIMLGSLIILTVFLGQFNAHPYMAIIPISGTLFGFQFLICNPQTLPSDCFNKKNVAVVAGFGGTSAVLGTVCTTWLVPVITRVNYTYFFLLAVVLVPLAWLCLALIKPSPQKIKTHDE